MRTGESPGIGQEKLSAAKKEKIFLKQFVWFN